MPAAFDAIAEACRERIPIVSVISEATDLVEDADGTRLGKCPLCGGGQIIVTERAGGCWRCACGQGDVITFTELHHKMTHQEAVIHLYGRLHGGTEPTAETPEENQ
jgi:DNA primase